MARDSFGHRWTGWPGAICYYCHSEDPREICLADQCNVEGDCPQHPMVKCSVEDSIKDSIDAKLNPPISKDI